MTTATAAAAVLSLAGSAVGSRPARAAAGTQPQLMQPKATMVEPMAENVGVVPPPFPTRGPDLAEMDLDLRKRQLFIGADTCGFISGVFSKLRRRLLRLAWAIPKFLVAPDSVMAGSSKRDWTLTDATALPRVELRL